jgi:uncharacterized membrane protein
LAETGKELPQAAVDNIETVARLREEAWEQRSAVDRLADAVGSFVGRVAFVAIHAVWFVGWAAFNTRLVPGLPEFDPYPFPLFGTLVSFEAVVISAFVLIKQNRMGLMAERRAHVELQMILLTEREVTKLIHVVDRLAGHVGLPEPLDQEAQELREHTEVEQVARAVHEALPE